MSRLYTHDCENCKYITTIDNKDCYVCVKRGVMIAGIILRKSSEGSDYSCLGVLDLKNHSQGEDASLANYIWNKFQKDTFNKTGANIQIWCDFQNEGKIYKQVFSLDK